MYDYQIIMYLSIIFPSFSVLLSAFLSLINRLSKQQNKTVNVGYHYM